MNIGYKPYNINAEELPFKTSRVIDVLTDFKIAVCEECGNKESFGLDEYFEYEVACSACKNNIKLDKDANTYEDNRENR